MTRSPLWRLARRRSAVLAVATALVIGGGGGLLAVALANGPAGADATLGGFTVTSLAEGATAQYEQPNLPLPSDPSLEFDAGYAATSDNFGPTGNAVASSLYPGQVIANAGPELALLVPGAPLPPAPVWPLEAVSDFPQTPNSASTDEPGVSMDAVSTADSNTATATLGDDAPAAGSPGSQSGGSGGTTSTGGGNVLAASSALIGIGTISGTSSSSAPAAAAIATATSSVGGISVLGGFITIGAVTSTAQASSDGTTGTVTGSTEVTNVNIAGEAVTIDSTGIHATGKSLLGAVPISALNTLLGELGITLSVTKPTDVVQGPGASRTLDGLKIAINLDTLDTAANKFASLIPASVTSKLPVPLPNMQLLSLDLGTVIVSANASPAFDDTGGDASAPDTSGLGAPSDTFTSPDSLGSTTGDTFSGGTDSGSLPSGVATTTQTTGGAGSVTALAPTSAVTPEFKGIGLGLLLLGLAMAAALAYAYKRVDDTSELVGPACADGDPLSDRFSDTGQTLHDAGDFTT
jgi:hypothetical protein